jgi:hypothetical protein
VFAAAIKSSAQVIVTTNLKHFPEAELRQWNVEAKSPDDFVLDQIHIDARIVYSCVREIANSRRNPRTPLMTCSRNWSGQAWCSRSLPCAWGDTPGSQHPHPDDRHTTIRASDPGVGGFAAAVAGADEQAFAATPPPRTTAVAAAFVSITSSLSRPRHPEPAVS